MDAISGRTLLDRLAVATAGVSRLCLWFSALGLVVMTAVIGWQVWGRYVLNDTPHWSERLSLFLMLYYVMFGAAVGVRERFHLGLVFFKDALPPGPRRAVDVAVNLCIGGFGLFMTVYGLQITESTWTHSIPSLGIPTGVSYLPFPIAGVLIILFSLEHILNDLAGRETPEA